MQFCVDFQTEVSGGSEMDSFLVQDSKGTCGGLRIE